MTFTRRTLLLSTVAGLVSPKETVWRLSAPSDLTVFHTNDLHGRVDVEGQVQGLAHLAPLVREGRRQAKESLLLDAGDILHGTPMEWIEGPAPIVKAFNACGFDAITVGNHEFDFGPENLKTAAGLATHPYLSANVTDSDGDPWGPLQPYKVFRKGDRRIGVFGLTTELTPDIQWPRTIASILFTDAEAAARKTVARLREVEHVDLVICLSHLGYQADQKLAHEAPGIDLIIGGHSHTRLDEMKVENGVPIVQTGAHGKALGRVDVWFDDVRPRFEYRLVDPVKDRDRTVAEQYTPTADKVSRYLDELLGDVAVVLTGGGLTTSQTPTAGFLAESVRAAHKADVGLFSAAHFSGSVTGRVSRRDVYGAMTAYTRQHVVTANAPTETLRRGLAEVNPTGTMAVHSTALPNRESIKVAGSAHVVQSLLLAKPGVTIVYDDPLGTNVREAVMEGVRQHLYRPFFDSATLSDKRELVPDFELNHP